MRELLSSKQVAKMLGVSQPTLSRWRSAGQGPPVIEMQGPPVIEMSGIFRYEPESVEIWIGDHLRILARQSS